MEKFTVEYIFNKVSPAILWNCISTPDGLSSWFADNVDHVGKDFSFTWNNHTQQARLLKSVSDEMVRFRWEDSEIPRSFFEMRITNSEITGSRNLQITDFAVDEDERKEITELWHNQIKSLKRVLGCV